MIGIRSLLLSALLVCLCCEESQARIFGRRGGGGTSVSSSMEYVETEESTAKLYDDETLSLQEIAQARANAMAERRTLSHSIHTFTSVRTWTGLGVNEGIGWSFASDPRHVATCICGRRVVADAHCRAANGAIYRVRFFRN